jgi:CheY-like chemotaxis protein
MQKSLTDVRTVLLVEDNEDVRNSVAALLVSHGYAVAEARDGQEALDYLQDNPAPCLILLDLVMPRMDGWEFLARKARNEKLATLPVVITSATEASLPPNFVAIRKPWNIADLLNLVGKYSLLPNVIFTFLGAKIYLGAALCRHH